MTRVAFLGTGAMGAPMARNLGAAGHEVRVWNRTRERAEGLGAAVCASSADAVDGVDVLVTMLSDGPTTGEAVSGTLRPGLLWAQMGTVGIEWNPWPVRWYRAAHPTAAHAHWGTACGPLIPS